MARPVVQADPTQVAETQEYLRFIGRNSKDAMRIGVNKSLPIVRTRASKEIRGQVRLTASYVRERLKLTFASNERLQGKISAPSRGLLVTRYVTGATGVGGDDQKVQVRSAGDKVSLLQAPAVPKTGIRVKVKPKGSTKRITGKPGEVIGKPFYMIFPGNRVLGVVARAAGGGIKVFYGASLSQVYDDVRDDVTPFAEVTLENQTLKAFDYVLRQQRPR